MRIFQCSLLLFVMLLAGCARKSSAPAPVPAPSPGLIVPNQGIPGVRLKESKAGVEKALGKPDERDTNEFNPANTFDLYHARGIEISFDKGRVAMITLHRREGQWKAYPGGTRGGLWVGSSPKTIVAKLGKPPEKLARALKYPSKGLWFRLTQKGEVDTLSIYDTSLK